MLSSRTSLVGVGGDHHVVSLVCCTQICCTQMKRASTQFYTDTICVRSCAGSMPKDSSVQSGPTAGGNVRANSHWSNVAPGEYFTDTFQESDIIPAHLEQSQFIGKEVKLMRDSGSGFTVSCHDDWSYQATVTSDTRYHALTSAASKIKYWPPRVAASTHAECAGNLQALARLFANISVDMSLRQIWQRETCVCLWSVW